MPNSISAPGIVGPFAGLDVPWLLRMRAEMRVLSEGDYARWQARAAEDSVLRFEPADAPAHNGWTWMPAR